MAKVDIGVACSGFQVPEWWTNFANEILSSERAGVQIGSLLTISSALPDHNKNNILTAHPFNPEDKKRIQLTDANRTKIAKLFLEGDADYLFTMDDDTKPPNGTLVHLLNLKREAVSGLYFNPKPPNNPLAYIRREDGLYHAYYGYTKGALQQVDSVGMGCTLIHRSVFEKIRNEFRVFERPNGSIFPIHKDDIVFDPAASDVKYTTQKIVNGVLQTPVKPVEYSAHDNRAFPFFMLEFGRTEDHHFWELANRVGIRPWVDTTIICDHLKPRAINDKHYYEYIAKAQEEIEREREG